MIKFNMPKQGRTIAKVAPRLIKEWDYERNYPFTPGMIGAGSSRKVWWKCEKGHSWEAVINNRVNGNNCPICNKQVIQAGVNSVLDTHPDKIAMLWDFKRNDRAGLHPDKLAAGSSSKKVYWKCPKNEKHLQWYATLAKVILGDRGCPECTRKGGKVHYDDSLWVTHRKLVRKEWDYPINNAKGIYPKQVSAGKQAKVAWKCGVAADHRWEASINKRALYGRGCPVCAGRKVVLSSCLATTHPHLAKEWNYEKNLNYSPQTVMSGSNKKVSWRCSFVKSHEWMAQICQRSSTNSGCPHCHLLPESAQEIRVRFELMHVFPKIGQTHYKIKTKSDKVLSADIYVPELNLAIEFDGSYWHRNLMEKDREKTRLFRSEGMKVIRCRESPLKKITRADVVFPVGSSIKWVVDLLLGSIARMEICNKTQQARIQRYLRGDSLKNEKEAEAYIRGRKRRKEKGV